jgi:hypothetical protein
VLEVLLINLIFFLLRRVIVREKMFMRH